MENLNLKQNMKIAGNLTISNWDELSNILSCENDDNWGLAFYFFEERIRTRYINPIKSIIEKGDNLGEGFAVINLQCSLIETIESFINGWEFKTEPYGWYNINGKKDKEKIKNLGIFESFFDKRKPFKDYEEKIDGKLFYQDVRCGLLHETQTKNNWKIRCHTSKSDIVYQEIPNGDLREKIIYRENFQLAIEELILNYKESIINKTDFDEFSACELRNNFRDKFNHICKESIPKQP